jgi:hypothetical protein
VDLPVHQIGPLVNGIFPLENQKLDQLSAERVYEFALIVQPLKIKGPPDPPWRQSPYADGVSGSTLSSILRTVV